MRARMPAVLPALLVALAVCAVPGCTSGETTREAITRPWTVEVLLSQDPPSLSLIGKVDHNTEILAVQITDSLLQFDERLELQPRLARAWDLSDDRLTLRE